MSHVPHDLAEEFPDLADKLSVMKQHDRRFAHLTEEYHAVNRQVHRAETNLDPMDQFAETALRKKRAALKDEIYAILAQ